jgi:hypothetical protein
LTKESSSSNPGDLAKKWSTEKRAKVMGSVNDQFILAGAAGKEAADDLAGEYRKKGLEKFIPRRSNQSRITETGKLKQNKQILKKENQKYDADILSMDNDLNVTSNPYVYKLPTDRISQSTKEKGTIKDYLDTQYAANHPFAKPMVMTPAEATPYTPVQQRYADGLKSIKNKVDDSDFLVGTGNKQNDFGSNQIGTPQLEKLTKIKEIKQRIAEQKKKLAEQKQQLNEPTIKQPTIPQQKEQVIKPTATQEKQAIREAENEVKKAQKKQAQIENNVEGVKTKLKNEELLEQQKKLNSEEFHKAFKEQMIKNAVVGGTITAGSIGGAIGIKGYLDRKKQRRLQRMNQQYK